MKIIKYHALDSSFPINAIAVSPNEQFIAIGDSNKQITIYNYQSLLIFYKAKPSENYPPTKLSNEINCYILSTISIPKLVLEFHTEQISALTFSNTQNNILFSAGYDKFIAVWKINPNNFSAEKIKVTQLRAEITDMALYPDDSYLLVSCFDNCVYILRCDFTHGSLEIVASMEAHDNIVNTIALDPSIGQTGRFASLSDKGRLIIACFNKADNSITITNNYEEFVNPKHKCNIIQKKIDWSVDGQWLISVDHHQIKKQNILHARLINMDNPSTSQALIGHDSPVLIARFSKCLYSEKNEADQFQLCATSDKNGNLIIWKVDKENFRVLVEISNYSESNITNMIWAPSGEYLFTVSSSGSVCTVEFNEFNIKITSKRSYEKGESDFNSWGMPDDPNKKYKKKITPTLISGPKNMIDEESTQREYNMNQGEPNYGCRSCLRCRKQLYQVVENVNTEVAVEGLVTKDQNKVVLCWENHPFENCSVIKMKIGSSLLFANKYLNRMIKLFTNSNFFYGFYDTNFTLNVYSLLNTPLITKMYFEEISILESYQNYVLLLTSQNRLIVINVISNERMTDENLNISSTPYNVFQTKIDSVFFISLDKIIIKADSFNPYKNTSNKMILYFDQRNNNLKMTSEELSSEEKKIIANANTERSKYHHYFEQNISTEGRKVSEIDCYKMSSEIELVYDAIYKFRYFDNTEALMNSIKRMFDIVQKKKTNFRYIVDDFVEIYGETKHKEEILQLYEQFNAINIEGETSKLEEQKEDLSAKNDEEMHSKNDVLNEDIQGNNHIMNQDQMIPENDVEMKNEDIQENDTEMKHEVAQENELFLHNGLSNPKDHEISEGVVPDNQIKEDEQINLPEQLHQQPIEHPLEQVQSYSSEQLQAHPPEHSQLTEEHHQQSPENINSTSQPQIHPPEHQHSTEQSQPQSSEYPQSTEQHLPQTLEHPHPTEIHPQTSEQPLPQTLEQSHPTEPHPQTSEHRPSTEQPLSQATQHPPFTEQPQEPQHQPSIEKPQEAQHPPSIEQPQVSEHPPSIEQPQEAQHPPSIEQPQVSEHPQSAEQPHPSESKEIDPNSNVHQSNESQNKEDQMEIEPPSLPPNEPNTDKNDKNSQQPNQDVSQINPNDQSLVNLDLISKKIDENKIEEIIKKNEENKDQMQVDSEEPQDKSQEPNKAAANPNSTN